MWIRKEVADYGQGLILYVRPYRDTADLSPSRIIKVRDSLLQKIYSRTGGQLFYVNR